MDWQQVIDGLEFQHELLLDDNASRPRASSNDGPHVSPPTLVCALSPPRLPASLCTLSFSISRPTSRCCRQRCAPRQTGRSSCTEKNTIMSSCISIGEQFIHVSNARLCTIVAFAIEVGSETASTESERASLATLRSFEANLWPGVDLDLDEVFPSLDEKKFWARVFFTVGHRIFLHRLGNHDVTSWQASTIGDTYVMARMLARAVQEIELGWYPETEAADEAASHEAKLKVAF
ncbi:hypothetical protein BE15_47205 [Sorangium cellulosum]|uniref:Uncharacterized protein n=2 Tax=Sorangium cellulosum TaxID=56 RepID=A0A150QYR7_SORCE|nr:hypothetical protein BE15_47205 [Sorangium cellulosum]